MDTSPSVIRGTIAAALTGAVLGLAGAAIEDAGATRPDRPSVPHMAHPQP